MARLYLLIGIATLSLYSWGQYRGVGLFDDVVNSNPTRLNPSQRNTFHK
jgi:hypothetical protein